MEKKKEVVGGEQCRVGKILFLSMKLDTALGRNSESILNNESLFKISVKGCRC